jgi:hypothetical protein
VEVGYNKSMKIHEKSTTNLSSGGWLQQIPNKSCQWREAKINPQQIHEKYTTNLASGGQRTTSMIYFPNYS